MGIEAVTLRVIDALNTEALPYMLVGSFSSNFYGIPRSTKDADFVVELEAAQIDRLATRLGPDFRLDRSKVFVTPGFSRVSGLISAFETVSTVSKRAHEKPLKRFFQLMPSDTRLKPGVTKSLERPLPPPPA